MLPLWAGSDLNYPVQHWSLTFSRSSVVMVENVKKRTKTCAVHLHLLRKTECGCGKYEIWSLSWKHCYKQMCSVGSLLLRVQIQLITPACASWVWLCPYRNLCLAYQSLWFVRVLVVKAETFRYKSNCERGGVMRGTKCTTMRQEEEKQKFISVSKTANKPKPKKTTKVWNQPDWSTWIFALVFYSPVFLLWSDDDFWFLLLLSFESSVRCFPRLCSLLPPFASVVPSLKEADSKNLSSGHSQMTHCCNLNLQWQGRLTVNLSLCNNIFLLSLT